MTRTTTHTVVVPVPVGADPLPVEYTSVGRTFAPESFIVQWVSRDGEPWRLSSAETRGPVLRKDGTPSPSAVGKRRLASYAARRTELLSDAPEWASKLVAENAPELIP